MPSLPPPDMTCVPFRRRGLYLLLTIPFLLLLLEVLVFLAIVHPLLAGLYVILYLLTCWFQAYCCAYQECPYVGGFCPGIAGIIPASLFARLLVRRGLRPMSKRSFETYAILALACWLALALFPPFWIARLSPWLAAGYVLVHLLYAVAFMMTICPACAIRDTCPGGRLQRLLPPHPQP
jgi:hypothetical protein